MKTTANTPRLIEALEKAAAGTPYQIQIRDYGTEVYVFVRKRDRRSEYAPEIYFEDRPFGKDEMYFTVSTTSYGSLKPAEIDLVIDSLRAGADFAKTLTALVNEAAQ